MTTFPACPGPRQRLVYSIEDAAAQISISERGLRQLIAAGDIRAIHYGEGRRRVGITHQALVEWIADRQADEPARTAEGDTRAPSPTADRSPLDADRIASLARSAHTKVIAGACITAAELAALVGLDERTVQRQAREGRYPSQQPTGPGGARRFSPEDVTAIREAVAVPALRDRPGARLRG